MKETRILTSTEIFSLCALMVAVYMERMPLIAVHFFSYSSTSPNISIEIFAPKNNNRFFVSFDPRNSDWSLRMIMQFDDYLIKHTGSSVNGWDEILEELGITEKVEDMRDGNKDF